MVKLDALDKGGMVKVGVFDVFGVWDIIMVNILGRRSTRSSKAYGARCSWGRRTRVSLATRYHPCLSWLCVGEEGEDYLA